MQPILEAQPRPHRLIGMATQHLVHNPHHYTDEYPVLPFNFFGIVGEVLSFMWPAKE